MTLDFTTLYVVILLNSIGIAVVWAGVAISYPKLVAARFWLGALICTSFGGIMLYIEAAESARFWTFLGIAAIGLGYSLIWQGVQVFLGRSARWPMAMGYMVRGTAEEDDKWRQTDARPQIKLHAHSRAQ